MLKYLELGVYGTDLKPSHPFIGSAIRGAGYALRKASCPFVSASCEESASPVNACIENFSKMYRIRQILGF